MGALEELQKWNRKHYRFRIECGGNVQPGDGVFVELKAGGRTVVVGEEEMEDLIEGHYPFIEELVLEALRRWHADTTPKRFRMHWWFRGPHPDGVRVRPATTFTSLCFVETEVVAPTEADAIEQILALYHRAGLAPPPVEAIRARELGPVTEEVPK